MIVKRASIVKVLTSVSYALLIDWLYRTEVVVFWEYQGFSAVDSLSPQLPIVLAVSLISLFLPNRGDTRSILVTAAHFLFFVPSIVFAFTSGADPQYTLILFISIFTSVYFSSFRLYAFRYGPIKRQQFLTLMMSFSFFVLALYSATSGIRSLNFNLAQVYVIREANSESIPGFLGYFVSLLSVVLLPMAMLYSISLRKFFFLASAIFLQLFFFGMTNFKNILFAPLLVIGAYVFLKKPSRRSYFPLFFFILPAGAVANYVFIRMIMQSNELLFFVNNFIRRLLFTPPMLDERHILFFSNHPLYYWSTSRVSLGLVRSPYDLPAPNIIGLEYFGTETWAANTGMIGSGFANAGWIGVLIYSILFGLLVALLNAYGKIIGHALVSSLALLTIMNITRSSDFTTVLLTHGLIFLLAFLVIAPFER